jgi:hypothetical protein
MTEQVAVGNFTGMITRFKNQSILLGMRPCVDLLHEIVGNDEFNNRVGTDDSTKAHMIQLVGMCDRTRRVITYNPEDVDIMSVMDADVELSESLRPINLDNIQMSSTPLIEIPWRFDGTDVNIPTWSSLQFRNGIGGMLYSAASQILVQYTRLESRNRSYLITVNDSLRMYSMMQTFRDLCDRFLGHDNQMDIAQPLATDEPTNNPAPNRIGNPSVSFGSSLQNQDS